MASRNNKVLCLFDVDGTLTPARLTISAETEDVLEKLKEKIVVGLVGGSDLCKIAEQMRASEEQLVKKFDYVFAENGLVAFKNGELIEKQNILKHIGETNLQKFINFALKEMSELTLPAKRGTFIEFRSGMLNVCPVGRSCSQAEREEFAAYDQEHHVRQNLVQKFEKEFENSGLTFAIGGQISIDVFPEGWDKRYALKHVAPVGYETIHFFGDKTSPGGNDHAIFADDRTVGHTVTSPEDTRQQLQKLFFSS